MSRTSGFSPLLLALACILPATGCSIRIGGWKLGSSAIQGNGIVATEERVIDEFDSVDVSGALQIELSLGSDPTLSITADENLLEIIDTQVVDGKLIVTSTDSYSSSNPVVIKAGSIHLKKYAGSGATKGIVQVLEEDELAIDLSGASSLTLSSGSVSKLSVDVSGASTVNAPELLVQEAKVEASGASTVILQPIEQLSARASGASTVRYVGQPNILSKDESGAASVSAKK